MSNISQEQYNAISAAYYSAMYHEEKKDVNMEEAFCLLDFRSKMYDYQYKIAYLTDIMKGTGFVKSKYGIPIGKARRSFIEVLEKVYGYNRYQGYINQDIYISFFNKLRPDYDFAIITTNYDLICESTLPKIGGHPFLFPIIDIYNRNYKINNEYIPAPLLKLHGSVDWKETPYDVPNIVPPTFYKQFQNDDKFKYIWREAKKAIQVSDTIIFIGYSLPKIDNHVRYLLKTGLQPLKNQKYKKNIFVVKRTWTCEDKKNYDFIMSSKAIDHFEPLFMNFKEFALSDIKSIIM